jgi:AbrB family looped-hinge helix DNA binding protein
MTLQKGNPMAARKYSRIQEKGQVTVPAEIRRKLGLEKGDLVSFEEGFEGILLVRQKAPTDDIEVMDVLLRPYGMTFQDLIDQMRDERVEYVKNEDGIELSARDE